MVLAAIPTIIIIGCISFFIWKKQERLNKKILLSGLILKLLFGIGLGLIYTYFYTANDTFLFFGIAKKITAFARANSSEYFSFLFNGDIEYSFLEELNYLEPRSLFFVKFLSVFNLLTNDNYWLSSLWFSFFSFLGCWYLFIRITSLLKNTFWPAAVSLFFFPSFVFWGSGIVKESLAVGALSFVAGIFLKIMQKEKLSVWEWIGLPITYLILWNLKYYWAAILVPAMITSVIMLYLSIRITGYKEFLIWLIVFLVLCLGVSFIHPNFYLYRLLGVIIDNHNQFLLISKQNGVIHYYQLTDSLSSMLINTPWAIISGLFRPFIFESGNLFHFISSVENFILAILCVGSLFNLKFIHLSPHRLLIYSAIVYILILCAFLALSTPNFGTLSRYRIGFLPFFLLLILYRSPLLQKIPFLKDRF